MLQRIFIHLSLILLFAFTQMGVVTHEISHLAESKQQQQDQNSHESQCEQCLSHSATADTDLSHTFTFQVAAPSRIFLVSNPAHAVSASASFYSARAPPLSSQV